MLHKTHILTPEREDDCVYLIHVDFFSFQEGKRAPDLAAESGHEGCQSAIDKASITQRKVPYALVLLTDKVFSKFSNHIDALVARLSCVCLFSNLCNEGCSSEHFCGIIDIISQHRHTIQNTPIAFDSRTMFVNT